MMRLVLILLCVLLAPAPGLAAPEGRARVVDGDTLTVAGEQVRLFAIDAPELAQTCARADGTGWDCGRWAKEALGDLIGGRPVTCAPRDRDRHGRVVATCDAGDGDLGRALVAMGAAEAFRRYARDYVEDEKRAMIAGLGIWQGDHDSPGDVRAEIAAPAPPAPGGCAIKGNVSANGARIYHLPGMRDYAATRIAPAKGERWFCSEAEARAAGWRAARS